MLMHEGGVVEWNVIQMCEWFRSGGWVGGKGGCAQAKRSVSLVMTENDDPKVKNEGRVGGGKG